MLSKAQIIAVIATASSPAFANLWWPTQKIGVPAFYPLSQMSDGVLQDGYRIVAADKAIKLVVVNFNSAASNQADFQHWYNAFKVDTSVPILMLGYVFTNTAQRSASAVLGTTSDCSPATRDECTSVADWYNTFNGYIDGIFLDVGPTLGSGLPTECQQQQYYGSTTGCTSTGLYQSITSAHTGPCNGHACVMLNASQFPNNWVLTAADYLTTWERPYDGSANALCPNQHGDSQNYVYNFIPAGAAQSPQNWYFDTTNAARSEHIVYSEDGSHMNSIVCAGRNRGAPMMYIHHENCARYSQLPSASINYNGVATKYFEAEVAAAKGCPGVDCGTTTTDACGNQCVGSRCDGNQTCTGGTCQCPRGPPPGGCGGGYWDDLACTCSN